MKIRQAVAFYREAVRRGTEAGRDFDRAARAFYFPEIPLHPNCRCATVLLDEKAGE